MRPLALALAVLVAMPVAAFAALPPAPAAAEPMASVTIYKDAFGVPQVFAPDERSLWYANGYVQAHDRLFAMDVLRHVGRGEAASFLGPSLLGSDVAVRRELYTEEQRLAKFLALDAATKALLQTYADGVNRAMAEMAARADLPAEFAALNHAPEPWTVLDSVAIIDFLLDRFGTGGGSEVDNSRLLRQLQGQLPASQVEGAFNDLVWGAHPTSYATLPGTYAGDVALPKAFAAIPPAQWAVVEAAGRAETFGVAEDVVERVLAQAGVEQAAWPVTLGFDPQDLKWGSNALVVAPSLSRDGRAMVGGGPQMGYFNPQVPWEVGLHAPGYDAVGIGVTGAPGIVVGRTEDYAWTVTSGISDQTDLVALRAAGADQYLWDGATRDLACRDEVHVVANPPAVGPMPPRVLTQRVCESHVGPIVAASREPDGDIDYYFASHKVHRGLELSGARQWLGVSRAEDLAGFRAAFEGFPFTFNFHYAGAEGACYHHVGTYPVRNPALDPRFPTPGGSAWDWSGMTTGAALPRGCNPDAGFYANWNNLPQRGWPSGDSRELWGSVHRVERLAAEAQAEILASPDGKLDLAQVKDILKAAATRDSLAAKMVAALLPHAPPAAAADLATWAADGLPWADADRDGLYDHLGHAWYDRVRGDLQGRVLGDELGPFLRVWNPDPQTGSDPHAGDHGTHDNKDALLLDALTGAAAHDWCDTLGTDAVETCAKHVAAAFAAAATPGPRDVHLSRFTPIGAGPAYTMPMTNRATYYHFHVGVDTGQSVSAIPPGQSGHLTPLDLFDIVVNRGQGPAHMRDQLPLYNDFRFKVVPTTRAEAQAVAASEATLLVPPGAVPWP